MALRSRVMLEAPRAGVTGRLVHLSALEPEVLDLGEAPFTLGRGPDGIELALPGPGVSRRHARLEPLPAGGHRVIDLGSTNGTLVNERRVTTALLELFDRVRVGLDR